MSALTGNPIKNSYGDVLQLGNAGAGVPSSPQVVQDGLGNNTGLVVWTGGIGVGATDCLLSRDAGNILAQRNGTNQQTFRVYNTYTDASNYERFIMHANGNNMDLATEAAGTGTARNLRVWAASGAQVQFLTGGGIRWAVDANGNFITGTDNAFDIGQSGATRPRNGYFSGGVAVKVKAGVPADGDFTNPVDGMLAVDSTDNKIYVRIGSAWKGVAVA